jgi:hypothetical protein
MATKKTLNTITLNGKQLTPAGDPSIPTSVFNWEGKRNLDGSTSYKYIPSDETATIPVVLDAETATHLRTTLAVTGWSTTLSFRDGSSLQISNAAIVNNPALDGEGDVELEIFGEPRWL